MALISVNRPGYANAQGVHFVMLDGVTTIRILIARKTLQGGGPTLEETGFLARFDVYRDAYEIVAKQKFESGDFKGSMTITLDDLVKFVGERRQEPAAQAVAA
jgi:Protein of unknown function (DUF1488)